MTSYGQYLNTIFPGLKVQKISINAGFSCPNRDGTIGKGGCAYCRNDSFSPAYCMPAASVSSQIENGKKFFSRKYPQMKFLAYFQSYTNTHGLSVEKLRTLYEEAAEAPDVVGIVVGTRPDTLPDEVVGLLHDINLHTPVFLEIGAETSSDRTLELINRHHTWKDVEDAVRRAADAGLRCGLHLIAGLPGEDIPQILRNVDLACRLPIETLKIHQLQILKDTPLLNMWEKGEISICPFSLEDYLDLCVEICRRVPSHIVIERFLAQSPPDMVVAPKWGLKNYQFMNLLNGIINKNSR
ncbi:MAG: TIGR01212 family radical SAM protein [Muribaculaceae bacterium]|nr:TIGR01212 family radical SAM protein [Muribaculaceae bacterium]MDE6754780.1 TIGR01212 family radical SAM protein [Muribaculaceae bacterium]